MTTAPDALQAAAAAYGEGRLEDAARLLTALCAQSPQDVGALHLLAVVHMGRKDWPQAADAARLVLSLDAPENIARKLAAAAVLLFAATNGATHTSLADEYAALRPLMQAALAQAGASWKAARDLFYSAMLTVLCADDAETGMRWLNLLYPGAKGLPGRGVISPFLKVKAYCAASGAVFREIASKRKIRMANGALSHEYECDPFSIAVIPGGEALCGWDFAVAPSGEILSDSGYTPLQYPHATWFPQGGVAEVPKALHLWPEHCEYIDADVIFLHAPARLHFGHWMIDFIPRLRALDGLEIPGLRICVPADIGPKHRELLALAGIKDAQLIECTLGVRYQFRRLVVVQSGHEHRPSLEYLAYLSRLFPPPAPAAPRRRRIFIVRSVPTRRIVNAEEVGRLLDSYGFESIDLEPTSIAAQREVFAQADLVVCTYGSDPLCAFFMSPGSDLVEFIYNAAFVAGGLETMTTYFRVNMHTLFCAVAGANTGPRQGKDADFAVDCVELQKLLDAIIARKAAGIAFQTPLEFHAAP